MVLQLINKSIRFELRFFLIGLRPLLCPAACRYSLTYKEFALEQLDATRPLFLKALSAIALRVCSCISLKPWR